MNSAPWYARHLVETGERYGQHARFALRISGLCALAAFAIAVHAVFPFLFESTGSRLLGRIDAARQARAASRAGDAA